METNKLYLPLPAYLPYLDSVINGRGQETNQESLKSLIKELVIKAENERYREFFNLILGHEVDLSFEGSSTTITSESTTTINPSASLFDD